MFAWPYLQSHMGMFTQQAGTSPSKSAHWATAATEGGVKVHFHLHPRRKRELLSLATCHQLSFSFGLTSNPLCCAICREKQISSVHSPKEAFSWYCLYMPVQTLTNLHFHLN